MSAIASAFSMLLARHVLLPFTLFLLPAPAVAIGPFATELVDGLGTDVGQGTSLNLDSSGNPHIAYWDQTGLALRYARKIGNAWAIETAGAPVGTGLNLVDQALDAFDNPHIVYYAVGPLRYARKLGGVWTVEAVGGGSGSLWWFPSIAVDASGNPHVTYELGAIGDIYYARKVGGAWMTENIDGVLTQTIGFNALVLDAGGNPHVCFHDQPNNAPYYARKSGGVWTIEPVDTSLAPSNFVASPIALALDAAGNPRVAYHDRPMGNLKFASKSGGVWTIEIADGSANDVGWAVSMALDELGNPHISYADWTLDNLTYARKSGGVWTIQTADGSPTGVVRSSLAVDDAGRAHIGYSVETTEDVKYARTRASLIEEASGKTTSTGLPFGDSGLGLLASPNPSRGAVTIAFRAPTSGPFDLGVFDASGRMVRTFELGADGSKSSHATWDRLDSSGHEVAPGTYFLRLTSPHGDQVMERVTILR